MTTSGYEEESRMDLTRKEVQEMAILFKALADKTRLRILSILSRREDLPVSSIAEALKMSMSRVSHHLSLLENLGFVIAEQEGKQVFHRISDECIIDIMRRSREHVGGR